MTPSEQMLEDLLNDPTIDENTINKLLRLKQEMAMQSLSDLGQELTISDEQALVWFKLGITASYPEGSCILDRDILLRQADEGYIGPFAFTKLERLTEEEASDIVDREIQAYRNKKKEQE
jgi:hypothetical protein